MSERRRAARLYESFREAPVDRVGSRRQRWPKALAVMGHVEFIGYMTTHGGKTYLYMHQFAPGSRPLLGAGTRRGQLYLLGGRFKVTSRGITDLSATGRVVQARKRFEVRQL